MGKGSGSMQDLDVSEVMTQPVISAKKSTRIRDVALQLVNAAYSGMPVTEEGGKLVGIITELDILHAVNNGKEFSSTVTGDIMTTDIVTAKTDTPITEVIGLMDKFNIIRLPIVKNKKLVGIVSRGDILNYLLKPDFEINS
jgi:CBS domain-containing protein